MKKLTLLLISFGLLLSGFSLAQTVVPDGGDLIAAYEAAADGDVLVLESGGTYITDDDITIDKSITIKAADGAAVRPRIIFTDTYFMRGDKDADTKGEEIKFQGIEIEGAKSSNYVSRFYPYDSISYIEFSDVVGHNIMRNLIRASDSPKDDGLTPTYIDSVLVVNSFICDNGGSNYSFFYFYGQLKP